MSATNIFETQLLELIFNSVDIPGITDTPSTNLFISLHTADPGEAGTQTTSEATYSNYARVPVERDLNGFTVAGDVAVNTNEVVFPASTGGSSLVTHFGIGLSATGAGTLLLSGPLVASLAVSNGITPIFQVGEMKTTVD